MGHYLNNEGCKGLALPANILQPEVLGGRGRGFKCTDSAAEYVKSVTEGGGLVKWGARWDGVGGGDFALWRGREGGREGEGEEEKEGKGGTLREQLVA